MCVCGKVFAPDNNWVSDRQKQCVLMYYAVMLWQERIKLEKTQTHITDS